MPFAAAAGPTPGLRCAAVRFSEVIAWRAAIQRITPGGSEFMDPASVEAWARKQNHELAEAKMKAAKAERVLRCALPACICSGTDRRESVALST